VLLLGAGGSAAANVLDALRRSSREYSVVGADASPIRLHLSGADTRIVIPRAGRAGYAEAVIASVREHCCEVVHAQPDQDVLALGAIRDILPAATYLPRQAVLELAADKLACGRQLKGASVPVPDSEDLESLDSVGEQVKALLESHERVWVRARVGAGARASLPVSSGAQAEAWIRWWHEERGLEASDFMASEMLPGREFAYQSIWQDGRLIAGQARERVEYLYGHLAPSGQSSTPAVARTVALPQVDEVALAAIRALDPSPRGVYCVDIKESADGIPKITEINAGRFFTTSNFFAAAGLNMPDMLMRCALREQLRVVGSSPLPADLYWIRMVDMGFALVPGDKLNAWPSLGS
jgi:carbamoyl-phosphate synthase large subunit